MNTDTFNSESPHTLSTDAVSTGTVATETATTRSDLLPRTSAGIPAACLDTADAAIYLSVSQGTMSNWRSFGTGPRFLRLGPKTIRYLVSDLDEWLASRDRGPGRR